MISALITLLILIVIVGIVFYILTLLLNLIPMQENFKQIAKVQCPIRFILGRGDAMAHPKAAQPLIDAARAAGKSSVVRVPGGHQMMSESPEEVLRALIDFLPSAT